MATLVKSQVRYFVRDEDCLGRGCLDLGEAKAILDDKGIDIRGKVRSACRRMLQKGCPRDLPGYDARIAAKHSLSGISVLQEPILTRTLPIPNDATFTRRDATPYIP